MENIKNKFIIFCQKKCRTFLDFKITAVLLVLWTISILIEDVIPRAYFDLQEFFFRFLFLMVLSAVFAETCFKGKWKAMLVFYLLAGILSGTVSYLIFHEAVNSDMMEQSRGIMAGYALVLIALTIYFSHKKTGIPFSEYVGSVFSNMLPIFLIYLVLSFVVLFLYGAAEELFDLNGSGMVIVLPFTLYLIPGCIYSLNHINRQINDSLSRVVKYIINIFSICMIVMGYGYVLKLILMRTMPSNEIFAILTALFCVSAPVWIMNEAYRDDSMRSRVVSILPYTFAPLILMQIYSVAVRIMDYGFTPERYLGVMVILFEAVTILFFKISREHSERILPVLAVLTVISVAVPGINMYSVSLRSQKYFLDQYLYKVQEGEKLSELEYKRFEGAYKYQKTRADSAIFDEKYGDAGEYIAQEKGSYEQTWKYLHGCQLVGEIDTAGYSQMNMLNQSDSYVRNDADEIIIDFSKFQFYKRETGETVEIDLADFYEKCLNYMEETPELNKEKDSTFMKQFNRIKVDENRVFYVNHFEIDFCVTKEKGEERRRIKSVNISGMLLEK